jgi:hypothetical protein
MNWGQIVKIAGFGLLQQAGVPVTPEQLGLKSSSLPTYLNSNFSNVLSANNSSTSGLTLPTPPTAPEDPTDITAQKSFNEALVAYNQQIQAYNQRLYTAMLMQFQQMQRQVLLSNSTASRSTTSASSSYASSYDTTIGTGGMF